MGYQTRLLDDYFERYSAAPTQETFHRILAEMQNDRGFDPENVRLMAGALSMRMRRAGNSCFQNARQYEAFVEAFTHHVTRRAREFEQQAAELDSEVEKGAEGVQRLRPPRITAE
jgi:hypothetical protein